MKKQICAFVILAALAGLSSLLGVSCSSDNTTSPPLSQFQPQIANTPDNFQFQITGAANVTTTVEYPWHNSGTRATINQSSSISAGSAVLTLFDTTQVQRYSNSLAANGTFASDTGTAGGWKVRVVLVNLSGTLNFRAQKL